MSRPTFRQELPKFCTAVVGERQDVQTLVIETLGGRAARETFETLGLTDCIPKSSRIRGNLPGVCVAANLYGSQTARLDIPPLRRPIAAIYLDEVSMAMTGSRFFKTRRPVLRAMGFDDEAETQVSPSSPKLSLAYECGFRVIDAAMGLPRGKFGGTRYGPNTWLECRNIMAGNDPRFELARRLLVDLGANETLTHANGKKIESDGQIHTWRYDALRMQFAEKYGISLL